MHLSQVRSAIEKDPELRALRKQTIRQGAGRQMLELSVEEHGHPSDAIPNFSNLTPQADELVVSNLLTTFSRQKPKLVGVTMTDVRDVLFLGRMIKNYCPDARLFTFQGDFMYQHPDYIHDLQGMLVVSNYPLFTANQLWTKGPSSTLTQFPNFSAEGIYNAVNYLLTNLGTSDKPFQQRALDYVAPFREAADSGKPPIWLSVVSRSGIWPVRLLTGNAPLTKNPEYAQFFKPSTVSEISFGAVLLFGITHCVSLWNWTRRKVPWPGWPLFRQFRIHLGSSHAPAQHFYVFVCSLSLMVTFLLIVAIIGAFREIGFDNSLIRFGRWTSLLALIALAGLMTHNLIARQVPMVKRKLAEGSARTLWDLASLFVFPLLSLCLIVASCLYWKFWVSPSFNDANGMPFLVYRITHPGAGVSPFIPLSLVFAGFYLWAFFQLYRISLLEEDGLNSRLESEEEIEPKDGYLGSCEPLYKSIESTAGRFLFHNTTGAVVGSVMLGVFAYICYGNPSSRFQPPFLSFEGYQFDRIYFCSLFLLSGLILFSLLRLLFLWRHLRGLLRRLDWHPMRDAFGKLGKRLSWTLIGGHGGQQQTLTSLSAALDLLRLMTVHGSSSLTVKRLEMLTAGQSCKKVLTDLWMELKDHKQNMESNLSQMLKAEAKGLPQDVKAYGNVQMALRSVATLLVDRVLAGVWNNGVAHGDFLSQQLEVVERKVKAAAVGSSSETGGSETSKHSLQAEGIYPARACREWLDVAEQFVALRFVMFLRPVLLQIQSLIAFVTLGFLLLLFSTNSYPFRTQRLLLTVAWVAFLAIGGSIFVVFVQMQRDATFSRLTGTRVGKVDWNRQFIGQLLTYGAVPLLGLLAAEFPQFGNVLFSWAEPAVRTLH